MKLQVCAVYDSVVKAYTQPFFARTVSEAIRSFADAVAAENSQFARHAADYHLALLGEFDDNDGSFVTPGAPSRLVTALELVPEVFTPDKQLRSVS